MTTLTILAFVVFAALGMPLSFALGFASVAVLYLADFEMVVMAQRMLYAVDNFPLMAIPLFILAGEIMVKAEMMDRLVSFSNSLIGKVHGGLAHVTILSGMILAAVSGAAVACASALGSALVPALRKHYPDGYTSAVIASAANLGPVIPPSNAMIVYALMAGSSVSVGALFIAGIVPGIILTIGFMAIASFLSWRRKYVLTGEPLSVSNILRQFRRAFAIVMMPIVVVGGIVGGVFTATEGAAIAVMYSLAIGFLVTRKLRLRDLPELLFRAAVTASMVGALIAFAAAMTFVFTIDMVPSRLATAIRAFTEEPAVFIMVVMAVLLVVGMLLESNAAYIMLVPLFAPIALEYGIDPLWFGFLFMYNLVVGMMTPPVGVLFFVMSGITRVKMGIIVRESLPYVGFQFFVLGLCIAFPFLVTALPKALGF
ncbi:MAG: TRAP transporter large permease [Burkholderiales bacterium]|nr:MAG: TRAP transporter large permease [Burkholderiales bacterium]